MVICTGCEERAARTGAPRDVSDRAGDCASMTADAKMDVLGTAISVKTVQLTLMGNVWGRAH